MFHVNTTTGEVGKCSAEKGKCPFGAINHYTSAAAARQAFEQAQAGSFKPSLLQRQQWSRRTAVLLPVGEVRQDRLGTPTFQINTLKTDIDFVKAGNTTHPANWTDMGSSEKDLWVERKATDLGRQRQRKDWHDDLSSQAATPWLHNLDDFSLDRLANVLTGNAAGREAFDKGIFIGPGEAEIHQEISERVLKELG